MGLEEPDRQEEWLGRERERLVGDRRDVGGAMALDLDHLVVADHVGVLRDVLLADQHRLVAGRSQRADEVLAIVVE